MTSRSERTLIREVLGNVMLYDKDVNSDDIYLGIYLDNGDEYYYKRHKHDWIRLNRKPEKMALGCGFAILGEQYIFGFGSKTYLHVIIDTDTFPGDSLDFGYTRIELKEEEMDLMH